MKIRIAIILMLVFSVLYANETDKAINTDHALCNYKIILSELNDSDPNSVIIARNELFNMFTKSSSEEVEECFREFVKFYELTVTKSNRNFYNRKDYRKLLLDIISATKGRRLYDDPLQDLDKSGIDIRSRFIKDSILLKELRNFRECGMKFHYGEGDWYLVEDNEFLYSVVNKLGPLEIKDYYLFIKEEQKERLGHDAGIMITWDQLSDRLIRWEKFSKDHPHLKETNDIVKRGIKSLFNAYLFGADNTPAYAVHYSNYSGKIDNKLLKSYERFISKYPDSEYHYMIKNIYDILKANDNVVSEDLISFFDNNGIPVDNLRKWLEKNPKE